MKKYIYAFKESRPVTKALCCMFFVLGWVFYFFVIFSLSAQNADSSTDLSFGLAENIARFFYAFSSEHTVEDVISLANYFEHPIRKLAHFTEYGILGVLFSWTFLPVIKEVRRAAAGKSCGLYVKITVLVFFLAALDEIHQFFVPGRYSSVWDVLLDTVGCGVFLFFTYLIFDRKKT